MIKRHLGLEYARQWKSDLFLLVQLTHQVLLYTTTTTFFSLSKTNKNKGLKGHMSWFSMVYTEPKSIGITLSFTKVLQYMEQGWVEEPNSANVVERQWLSKRTIYKVQKARESIQAQMAIRERLDLNPRCRWCIEGLLLACARLGLTTQVHQQFWILGRQTSKRGVVYRFDPIQQLGFPP